jgi:hypothetical protein
MESEEEEGDRLTLQEKMAQEADQLRRWLDQDPTMMFILQRCQLTPYNSLPCNASECLVARDRRNRQAGTLRHRILVDGVDGFYHVPCLEAMLDLPLLAPSRFMLDTKSYDGITMRLGDGVSCFTNGSNTAGEST